MDLRSGTSDGSLPSSAEPSSTARRWKYDVFLSYRGRDTRRGIISYLYHELQRRGIEAFMDDPDLQAGDAISPIHLKAIEVSRFAIVVLSPNYASSTWCLDELTNICDCMEDGKRIFPLFYDVEPSDVRFCNKSFGQAFEKHESSKRHSSDKMQQWRDALKKVASFYGWNAKDFKTDGALVDSIVDAVSSVLQLMDSKFTMSAGEFEQYEARKEPPSTAPWPAYDVFLSFKGSDTRKAFTSHLYGYLQKRGIKAFMGDSDLEVGDAIFPTLLKAIERSRFAIVVLSQNYASSTWCLEELTKICQLMESGHRIIPIFYDVDPSDVRHQKGSFQDAFTKLKTSGLFELEKVQLWKDALRRTADFSGWVTRSYSSDIECVKDIVEYVWRKVESDLEKVQPIEINIGDFEVFEATRRAMDAIMEALKDDVITAVGVYGVGGVGKTAMIKHVSAEVQNSGMFSHVIMVVVSRSPDLRKIQCTLADMLGFILEEEAEMGRSRRLMQMIRRGDRILIILDDIWERIDFSHIGIPSHHELQRCNTKVLLTTRRIDVCHAMKCQTEVCLDVLSEQDSLTLLVNRARKSLEPAAFCDVARKVAKECAGLPLALIAVAKALRGKWLDDWKEAARQLKSSHTANSENGKVVFNCIKLSYHYLGSGDARSCFLLCCLFPEDYDIQIEDLLKYGMGTRLFQDSRMQDARARVHSVVKDLIDCSLLLETEQEGCVRMHDVIRDVAISISAFEDGSFFCVKAGCQPQKWPIGEHKGYSAISLIRNKICKLPDKLVCPKLIILLLQSNVWLDAIPDNFFCSPNELRVLDLSRTRISSLPVSFNNLIHLQALYLDGCGSTTDNISILGNLKKLEILSMRELPLAELPKEIGELSHLRMLDITGDYVDNVPSEVICKLSLLEELYMQCNFADWGSKVEGAGEENNVAFDELLCLSRLEVLKVFVSDAKCLPIDVEVEPIWVNFDICISRDRSIRNASLVSSSSPAFIRALTLDTTINALPAWFINVVTTKAEKIQYMMCWGLGNILEEFDCGRLHELKYLSVVGPSENLKVLMDTRGCFRNEPVFQNLEELHLLQVDCLKQLCVGEVPVGSLCNLRLLKVKHCYELVDALLPSQLLHRLQNLEKLICEEIDELEYVFGCEGLEPKQMILTQLIEMRLENLGNLIKIWNGPAPCAMFQNLQILVVSGCCELENLFTADVAQCLLHLEDLSVELCPMLGKIIEASEHAVDNNIVFPAVKNLALLRLPQLTKFYGSTESAVECPLLEYLCVERCPIFSTRNFHSRKDVQGTSKNFGAKMSIYNDDEPILKQNTTGTSKNFGAKMSIYNDDEPILKQNTTGTSKNFGAKMSIYNDDEPILKQNTTEEEADVELDGTTEARIINKQEAPLEEGPFKVLLELKGVGSDEGRLGVDLVTILDISGSMKGTKIAKMQLAMQFLVQKLGRTDRLSVVTFNRMASRLCPLRQITEKSRTEITDQIDALAARSSTNTEAGLKMALEILNDRSRTKRRRAAIMLMSDGIEDDESDSANVPVGSVPVYTFGFGSDCDGEVLRGIAKNGGTYADVVELDKLNVAFSMSLAGLLNVAIEDLSLTITLDKGAKFTAVNAGNYQQTKGSEVDSVTITFGSLYDREIRNVLVNLTLPKVENRLGANYFKISYKYRVGGKDTIRSNQRTINVTRVAVSTEAEKEEVLVEEKRIRTASKMKEARLLADAKKLEEARKKLEHAKTSVSVSEVDAILRAQLDQLLVFMVSQETYDKHGRAFALAVEASHDSQRAQPLPNADPAKVGMFTTPLMDLFMEQAALFDQNPTGFKVPTLEEDKKIIK